MDRGKGPYQGLRESSLGPEPGPAQTGALRAWEMAIRGRAVREEIKSLS